MSKLSNPSLLLLRNEDELCGNNILVINTNRDGFLSELSRLNPNATINAFSYNVADHNDSSKYANVQSFVSHSLPALKDLDLIIYYYPKSKPEALMMLDNIRSIASKDTRLLVVGDNKGGVKSVEKQLKPFAEQFYKLESAKHCVLYEFSGLEPIVQFDIKNYQSTFNVTVAGHSFSVASVPGVFNHGKLDVGTQLLLSNISVPYKGKVLDFGCGAGIIATFLGTQQSELKLHCLDVNALAIYATEQTLALNNLTAECILSDGMSDVSGQYHLIISNPPFHTGIATDYGIAERFLEQAKSFLKPNGQIQIVANNFLKYPPILEQQFGTYAILAKNTKFTVYQASR
ncbi:ribosomal RNA small subunit methyltransferase C [Pseudoalteromonas sp. A25]|uniref:16S rRNA (guanine(1207)-N(2))-methyltransferase RsmC n=1 Tax=Pseudoalteromonas sp. A25 TaxID=116092 RepID=UPI00126059FC|nr:16S rRNA (guanine(1207)-N(2))-methyltransferase RsmC [Pseudoalteromonas sp. A25]BBN82594.1 ribosomal RNA small subunit methyltransferase C [Pseudoalteromonas sp. A25]